MLLIVVQTQLHQRQHEKSTEWEKRKKKTQTKEIKKSNRTQIAFPLFKNLLGDSV